MEAEAAWTRKLTRVNAVMTGPNWAQTGFYGCVSLISILMPAGEKHQGRSLTLMIPHLLHR